MDKMGCRVTKHKTKMCQIVVEKNIKLKKNEIEKKKYEKKGS